MGESYLKIGSYTPETEEQEAVIDRDYFRQGWRTGRQRRLSAPRI